MKRLAVVVALLICGPAPSSPAYEGRRDNSILLNGAWEFALGTGREAAEAPAGQAGLSWKPVTLPGPFVPWSDDNASKIRFVWARRSFSVTEPQARSLAVLRWNRIAFGATAYLNGMKVGENAPTGPYQVILPAGSLQAGENQIVLRIPGAAGAPKAASGFFLIPAGFPNESKQGLPEVTDDVWIDFAEGAYMKWMLAIPDLAQSRVSLRVTTIAPQPLTGLALTASVRPWPEGPALGRGEAPAEATPDGPPETLKHAFITVPMQGYKPWTPEEPNLYVAEVRLLKDGRELDRARFRFGMREITTAGGDYKLNGKTLRFRGSELVFEWNWGGTFQGREYDYLVTEAREMSHNAFRTHTQPPPALWADICDENGIFLWAEFPVLYNYRDFQFTPAEYEVWHRNVLSDAAGWMARLWNHPSVVMWVLSNESSRDSDWETGPYYRFVKELDPTRPTMRTGDTGTPENYDIHTCNNVTDTEEGRLMQLLEPLSGPVKGRTFTNSEYMNAFGRPITQWSGTTDKEADALAVAQIGMEHTEAMRRIRMDGVMPYMYAGTTKTRWGGREWKGGYASPASAAWHSALSPVLASLDLFDPNYLTGQKVTTPLFLINDSWHPAEVTVDLILTRQCPGFLPEAAAFEAPVARWTFKHRLEADSLVRTSVTWTVPEQEGSYWLTARTTGIPGRPVLSQRFVRAIGPAAAPERLKRRTVVLLGAPGPAEAYLTARGVPHTRSAEGLNPAHHVVLIWNASRLTSAEKALAPALAKFAEAGGRIVALAAAGWGWPALCDVTLTNKRASRAFFDPAGAGHPALRGIGADWLTRWNGLPGTVAASTLEGRALSRARKLLWMIEPKHVVAAELPLAQGSGTLLMTTLDIHLRLDRSKPTYEPVAERLFLNLLSADDDSGAAREESAIRHPEDQRRRPGDPRDQ